MQPFLKDGQDVRVEGPSDRREQLRAVSLSSPRVSVCSEPIAQCPQYAHPDGATNPQLLIPMERQWFVAVAALGILGTLHTAAQEVNDAFGILRRQRRQERRQLELADRRHEDELIKDVVLLCRRKITPLREPVRAECGDDFLSDLSRIFKSHFDEDRERLGDRRLANSLCSVGNIAPDKHVSVGCKSIEDCLLSGSENSIRS